MNRSHIIAAMLALSLSGCSDKDSAEKGNAVAKFDLASHDDAGAGSGSDTMPGKIDPPDAVWRATANGATYGEPGRIPLIELVCDDGMVAATRNIASDKGAKALFAFVGYRGILRLKVESDGKAWRGALRSDDPHWIAVTGGPFYATVAGGGKVISPASSIAAQVIQSCKPQPDATIKGAPGEGEKVEGVESSAAQSPGA
ncbi:hypothetical protein EKN06_13385 [Croceicoccus ponticola]|uniref:Uncharacterized protein n=1 Tax=Croceicoccus ponticola TaxID=2217664 RepID=A0A437GV41_9SPHN|nr:hypothetical protein [Croceicoccus ponticola]RVQ65517.1 hypothetical protein EKN06_13385 [Croceicoccus ponticola]